MDEDDVDEDHLREYEAKLYAAIYHQPLSDILNETNEINRFKSCTDFYSVQASKNDTDGNDSVVEISNLKNTIVLSCDDTDSSSLTTLDDDVDLNISSNLDKTRTKRLEIPFSQIDSFTEFSIDKTNEFHSAEEIQEMLPKNPEFWQILDEDTWEYQIMSKNRYYAKRSKNRCRTCNEEGHVQKNCPNKGQLVCFICGIVGHSGFKCSLKSCMLCLNTGHLTSHCKMSKVKILQMTCRRCGRNGHYDTNCPEHWRQFHFTACPDFKIVRLKRKFKMKRSKKAFCYNCAKKGHLGHECAELFFNDSRLLPFHPNIIKYDTVENLNASVSSRQMNFSNSENVERSFHSNSWSYFDAFPPIESTKAKHCARFEQIKTKCKRKLANLKMSNWPDERLKKEKRKIKKRIRSARRRLEKANPTLTDQQNSSLTSKYDLRPTQDANAKSGKNRSASKIDRNWKRALKQGLDKIQTTRRLPDCQVIEVPASKRQRLTFQAPSCRSSAYSWEENNDTTFFDRQQPTGSTCRLSNSWFD